MILLESLDNAIGVTQQEYDTAQEALIPVTNASSEFNPETDRVVFSLETLNGDLLYTNPTPKFNIQNYQNSSDVNSISSVVVFPIQDAQNAGYNVGAYNLFYNFYKTALNSTQYSYFIQEISPNRTEIRLAVNNIDNSEIESLFASFSSSLQTEGDLFKDFYLNVGDAYYIANNTILGTDSENYTILIKLYQPLPQGITTSTQAKVVLEAAETVGFKVTFPITPVQFEDDVEYIKGPNFNIGLLDEINNSTSEQDLSSLTEDTQLTSSYNELQNILNQKGIKINVDYTSFENFVHFSSAEQRVLNFYYKVSQIEDYNTDIAALQTITGSTSSSVSITNNITTLENNITDIISNFDGYENYLYYTSGTLAYPKSNATQPYTLQSTSSAEVQTWLADLTSSAHTYDSENQDNLWYTVPTYLREDPINAQYELFVEMIGQHFDIIYTYIDGLNQRYNGDNRLDYGISKDLVADALRSMGVKLYQNNFSTDDLYSAFLGINASGSLLPPTGSELIETYITASNVAIPLDNVSKETYKRLYHNLPYLLKKKGTVAGLRALITCYGIPDTILRISEFGGKDKIDLAAKDYTREVFDLDTFTTSSVSSSQPLVGLKNRISDKIRTPNESIIEGDTLSYYRTVQTSSEDRTIDVNYIEVAFSPQNEINDQLTASLNIGEYIGDPRFQTSSLTSYPELDTYRNTLFEDLGFEPYDWKDYIRLIKYFDNSLFKMIKDFVPAKSELSTGVVIKQHMLERNRVRPPQTEISQHDYSGSIQSGFISGSSAGVYDNLSTEVTQSWTYEVDTQFGPQTITQSTQDEFYNGELSGSNINVTDGELGLIPPLGTTQTTQLYSYINAGGTYQFGVVKFDDPTTFETAIINTGGSNLIEDSIYFLDQPNVGITQMTLGYRSNALAYTASLEALSYGDTFTLTITDNGPYTPQPINVPYTFTISNIIKYDHYFRLSFASPPSQPNPSSYLLNGIPSTGAKLVDVDIRVAIINTPPENLVILKESNPLINNAVEPQLSTIYQDIDYSGGTTHPINYIQLSNGTAAKAPIQDSNYTQKGWSNARYNGTRVSSLDFNIKRQ